MSETPVTDAMLAAARAAYSKSVGCDDTPHVLDGWIDDALRSSIEAAMAVTTPAPSHISVGNALADALSERQRQVDAEGWIPQHDDQYRNDELPRAAMCYLLGNAGNWPWSRNWWKPTERRRDLIKAAALIIAEIERIDRAATPESQS